MFFDHRHRAFYIQCKKIISVSATMIIASISKLSSSHALFLPIFDSCFLISVSFTDGISHCTGSVGSSSSLSLCAGLHNLFAKGFKAGWRQTLILLLYQGLGPATENLKKKKNLKSKNYYFLYKKLKKYIFYFFTNPDKSGRQIRKPSN